MHEVLQILNFIATTASYTVLFQMLSITIVFIPVSMWLLRFVHRNITTDLFGFIISLIRSDPKERLTWMTLNLSSSLSTVCIMADGFCGTMWKFTMFFSVVFCADYFILIPIVKEFF